MSNAASLLQQVGQEGSPEGVHVDEDDDSVRVHRQKR